MEDEGGGGRRAICILKRRDQVYSTYLPDDLAQIRRFSTDEISSPVHLYLLARSIKTRKKEEGFRHLVLD